MCVCVCVCVCVCHFGVWARMSMCHPTWRYHSWGWRVWILGCVTAARVCGLWLRHQLCVGCAGPTVSTQSNDAIQTDQSLAGSPGSAVSCSSCWKSVACYLFVCLFVCLFIFPTFIVYFLYVFKGLRMFVCCFFCRCLYLCLCLVLPDVLRPEGGCHGRLPWQVTGDLRAWAHRHLYSL